LTFISWTFFGRKKGISRNWKIPLGIRFISVNDNYDSAALNGEKGQEYLLLRVLRAGNDKFS